MTPEKKEEFMNLYKKIEGSEYDKVLDRILEEKRASGMTEEDMLREVQEIFLKSMPNKEPNFDDDSQETEH